MEPTLIVFAGPPCSGKTALAERISRSRGISLLQMDETRARLLPDAPHTREDRRVAYRAMHWAAELLLSNGVSVILDAPYGHEEDRREIQDVIGRTRARLRLVECSVSAEIATRRFRERPKGPRLDLTEMKVDEMNRTYPYQNSGLRVETDHLEIEKATEEINKYLGE